MKPSLHSHYIYNIYIFPLYSRNDPIPTFQDVATWPLYCAVFPYLCKHLTMGGQWTDNGDWFHGYDGCRFFFVSNLWIKHSLKNRFPVSFKIETEYNCGDIFPLDFEPQNGIPFCSKSKGKLSSRSYSIQFERKWKSIFQSVAYHSHEKFKLIKNNKLII